MRIHPLFAAPLTLAISLAPNPLSTTPNARAEGFSLLVGNRGATTTDVPDAVLGLKLIYVSKGNTEMVIETLGFGIGKRASLKSGLHFSGGGAFTYEPQSGAAGPALTGALAYDLLCLGTCITAEFTQQIGYNVLPRASWVRRPVFSTFAFRMGVSAWW